LSFTEFLISAFEAWDLLSGQLLPWLVVVAVFLVVVESLMFIPYIGFVVKLGVAGVVVAQILTMFAASAAGHSPHPMDMLLANSFPRPTQVVLAAAAVVPFLLATLYLYLRAGVPATRFFYGNIFKTKPPIKELLLEFKYAMQIFNLPVSLVAGAVVFKGLSGWPAITVALAAAQANWVPVILLGLMVLSFEWLSIQLTSIFPKPIAAVLGIGLMVLFMTWSLALMYTVSLRVFTT
jgi:hypothetical protein